MVDGCTTLEKRTGKETSREPDCWRHFDEPIRKIYTPVSRPGWYDVGINGGGDIDLVDYEIEEKEE